MKKSGNEKQMDENEYLNIQSKDIYEDGLQEKSSDEGSSDMQDSEQYSEQELIEESEANGSEKKKKRKMAIVTELLFYVVMILLCIFVIPQYVIQRTIVDGASMQDTLKNNDNLLVEKVSYRFGDPKRFDVIVFYPYGKELKEYYVKRIIGLPGETIQIIGEDIYIDGEVLEEDYGKMPIDKAGIAEEPLELAKDEYFVMGDNREISYDSRYEDVGPVKRSFIAGKAVFRIWPLKKIGFFE